MNESDFCSCGRRLSFSKCCGPLLKREAEAADPESLMRSRYSAFIHKDIDYLFETLDPQARADFDRSATENWANHSEFLGLEIIKASHEGNKGLVEFKAKFKKLNSEDNEEESVHHEVSKFRKHGGVWYFRDGKMITYSRE